MGNDILIVYKERGSEMSITCQKRLNAYVWNDILVKTSIKCHKFYEQYICFLNKIYYDDWK